MKFFSQQNLEWKNKQLGTGDCTIGQAGCLLTDFAMITDKTPALLNDQMVIRGGFTDSLINSYVLPSLVPSLYFEARIACPKTPAPIRQIDIALSAGKVVIVQLDTSPVEGIQSHWVILTGKVGNDYSMVDPWPLTDNPPSTVLGRYGKNTNGSFRKIEEVITYVYIIAGVKVEAPVANTPASTEPLPVELSNRVTISTVGLRGRTSPGVKGIVAIDPIKTGLQFDRCTDEPIIKDGHKWIAVKLWLSTGTDDGKEAYVK